MTQPLVAEKTGHGTKPLNYLDGVMLPMPESVLAFLMEQIERETRSPAAGLALIVDNYYPLSKP